jgi:ATP synthase protein I
MNSPQPGLTNQQPRSTAGKQPKRESDLEKTLQRDFQRHRRRDTSHRTFWRWLGVLGMVGWPLAIATVGGAWLGHFLDLRFRTGIQFTLMLMTAGLILGSLVVWTVLKGTDS